MSSETKVIISMRKPWRSGLIVPSAIAGLTALLAQSVFNAPTLAHEFTTLFSIVMGLAFYAISGKVLRGMYASQVDEDLGAVLQRSMLLLLIGALGAAAVGLGVMYAFNEFRHGCFFEKGMPFFWSTWTPIVLFSMVMGLWTAARGWGWLRRLLLLIAFSVALSLHDWVQMEMGVRPVDPLFGLPLFVDQRADMAVPQIHFYNRVGVLLITLSLWCTCLWWQGGAGALMRRWATLSWAVTILYVAGFGSHVGLGLGKGKIISTLPETRESEHFIFHYAPHGTAASNIDATVRYGEYTWSRLASLLEVAPTMKTTVYLTDDRDVLWELSGLRAANALPWRLMASDDDVRSSTFAHELVHAFDLGDARGNTEGRDVWAARERLLRQSFALTFYRGPTEGVAHAFSEGYALTPLAHRRQAAALAEDKLPSATVFMGRGGFMKLNESNAYELAGSFMGFLVQAYGAGAMHDFLDERLEYERAFGKDLEALDGEWRSYLQEVPLQTADVAKLGRSFDTSIHKSYADECCPKLGSRIPVLKDVAYDAYRGGRYEEALDAYESLYEESGDLRHRLQQVKIHWEMVNSDLALALLDTMLAADDLSSSQRLEFSRWRMRCLAELGAWVRLDALLDGWPTLEPDATEEERRKHRLLRDPRFRARYAVVLSSRDSFERRHAVRSLVEEYPEDEDVRYAFLGQEYASMWPRWGRAGISPENRKKLIALMGLVEKSPEIVDVLGRHLERFVRRAIEGRDFDFAERLVSMIEAHTTDSLRTYQMKRYRARIDFERDYGASQ
jgi:hypothetical protein